LFHEETKLPVKAQPKTQMCKKVLRGEKGEKRCGLDGTIVWGKKKEGPLGAGGWGGPVC